MDPIILNVEDLENAIIPIGKVAENLCTQVQINCKARFDEYPTAVVTMAVTNPNGVSYPATIVRDGNIVKWDVKNSDLVAEGRGKIQLTFTVDTIVKKSDTAIIAIDDSIVTSGVTPDPLEDFVTEAEEVLEDVKEALHVFPKGGSKDQVLTKNSGDDYDASWKDSQGGGGGGTTDYDDLDNKPQIAGTTLSGNKSLSDLGIAAATDIPDVSGFYTKPQTGIPATDIADGVIPDPTDLIDDTAGDGDTDKVWSADKTAGEVNSLSSAIESIQDDIPGYVDDWLDDHPEATTTVQDGSITKAKLASDVANMLDTAETNDVSLLTMVGANSVKNKAVPAGTSSKTDLVKIDMKNGVQYTGIVKLKQAVTKMVYVYFLESDGTVIGYSSGIAVGDTYIAKITTASKDIPGAKLAVNCGDDFNVEYAAIMASENLIDQFAQTMVGDDITILSTSPSSGKVLSSTGVVTESQDSSYFVTNEVTIAERKWYMVTGSAGYGNSYYAIYDEDHNVISNLRSPSTSGTSVVNRMVYTPERAKYIRIAFASSVCDGMIASCETLKAKNTKAPEWFGKFIEISYSDIGVAAVNTLETYLSAGKFGFNACKGDVRPTSDGKLIMCHDAGFTFDGSGRITTYNASSNTPIHNMTYAECMAKEYAARSGASENNHYQKVADIDGYLDVCKQYGMIAYITIRDEYSETVCAEVMAALNRHGMRNRAVINSYTPKSLTRIRMMDDDIPVTFVQNNDLTLTEAIVNRIASFGKCAIVLVTANDVPTYIGGLSSVIDYANQKGVGIMFAQPLTMDDVFYLRNNGICGVQIGRTILPYQFNPVKFKISIANSTPSLSEWNNLSTMDATVTASDNVISVSEFEIAGSTRGFPDLILDVWMNKFPYRITAVSEGGHTVTAAWQNNALKLTVADISVNDTIDVIIEV